LQAAPRSHNDLLHPAWAEQDSVFHRAFRRIEEAIAQRAFPGAAVSLTHRAKLLVRRGFGRFTYDEGSPEVAADSIFDLASVSKVVATTTMAMILYERGALDLEMRFVEVLPELKIQDPGWREITLRHLLSHRSGLPAYEKLFFRVQNKQELVREALRMPLRNAPGTHAEYSDIGFIVLGLALEKIADENLASFCQREVFGPLGMCETGFNPPAALKPRIPPTADDREFRKRVIQGEVQDENASVMGGVAPHAGLFATAADLSRFAQSLINGGSPLVSRETVSRFTCRQSSPPGTSRALGWDTPSPPSQSGRYLSESAFGHLGYTGTSLWIDPQRELSITLLTNRTWPDCANQAIREIRPRVHDALIEALEGAK
jgi:serine-type D-Ala-D-Ala carboxypeptidase